jgi:alpha-amylase/alpha-mannosidase (GH57 family)
MDHFVCLHGHFYQPPRENPWLEDIEVQDSAHPFHDWNQRITAECYGPNAASRVLDQAGRIVEIVDNYRDISFNFGPTLLSWMERKEPDVYRRIVEADRASLIARSGHGNALAQVYNHIIMPLASPRDRETQVVWGIRDFERRFGRKPEGMWLAETAADTGSLEALAAQGIKFTVLSPTQAHSVRPLRRTGDRLESGGGGWENVSGGRVDPSRPYLWRSPNGAELSLFFYDAPISRAVAFEGVLSNGDVFAKRLLSGFSSDRVGPQLMNIATDGESYGHHHRFGDMALAFALKRIRESGSAQLTNYGEFLVKCPPTWEVQIHENSSWSCSHGVERWRSNCGCRLGGHDQWTQEWRGPLRESLNRLAGSLDILFEKHAALVLQDPWVARNDYIDVILDRSDKNLKRYFEKHTSRSLSPVGEMNALRLLEMQRQRLLMFTSCAWFFDEVSGLESTSVLMSAARAIQLGTAFPEGDRLEADFLLGLADAKSNLLEMENGAMVYRRFVKPVAADLQRVAAHQALKAVWKDEKDKGSVYCFDYDFLERRTERLAGTALSVGNVRVQSQLTRESMSATYAVIHIGGHDFQCALRVAPDQETMRPVLDRLLEVFKTGSVSEALGLLSQHFDPKVYDLQDLFLEERRRVLSTVIEDVLGRFEGTYRLLVEENKKLMNYLLKATFPMPHAFRLALESVLGRDLHQSLIQFEEDPSQTALLKRVQSEAKAFGVGLNWAGIGQIIQQKLEARMEKFVQQPSLAHAQDCLSLLSLADDLELPLVLWVTENHYFALWNESLRAKVKANPTTPAHEVFQALADRLRLVATA